MNDLMKTEVAEILQKIVWKRNCPHCGNEVVYSSKGNLKRATETNSCRHKKRGPCPDWVKHKISVKKKGRCGGDKHPMFGKHHSEETKQKLREISLKQFENGISEETKLKLRISAANQPRDFLGKAVDNGQLEMINCWNKLGFNFEVNYKLHTNDFLYFLDGYDKEHNVVLEYDSKYHNTDRNVKKDLIRQNNIISILKPNKFWRYNSVNKQCKNVLEKVG